MRRVSMVVAVGALVLAACGGGGQEASGGGGGGQAESPTVEVASTDVGDIVVDSEGMALYMFVPDQQEGGEPTCYDDCAQTWPALEAEGEPVAGDGIDESLLGTVERTDGGTQVSYNDLPLYHYAGDEAAGDTNGQGISDVWWLLSPDGEPLKETQGGGGGGRAAGGGY
jgi:predicted lipoprotein with Yx(FWY)xxD motif